MNSSNIYLKYKGIDNSNDSNINLMLLGESIMGFDRAIKEIHKISKISGNFEISATNTREGSLIIDIAIGFVSNMPFENVQDYLDFLQIASNSAYKEAVQYFSEGHRDLNDFFAKNPLDLLIISNFISFMFGLALRQKQSVSVQDDEGNQVSKDYAIKLHKSIKKGKFKGMLRPFIENNVSEMIISPTYVIAHGPQLPL